MALLLASCVVGLAISFTGWYCRSQVTATCYTARRRVAHTASARPPHGLPP